jgi:Protein of unknown function (DUF3486)
MPPRSKIAQLPEEMRQWLHRALVDRAFGDIEGITQQLNQMLREQGQNTSIGKTAVGVESQRVKRAQEALRTSLEAARLLQQDAGAGDDLGGATIDLVQSEVFNMVLKVRDLDDQELKDADRVGVLNDLALSASRLSRSRVNQDRWRQEVQAKAVAAADKVAKLAQKGGLQPKTVQEIRRSILGIATADAVATAKGKA